MGFDSKCKFAPPAVLLGLLLSQDLVKILHKALEAAQQEKRVSIAYLAAAQDKDRLELVRHKVRQIAEP